MPPNFNKTLESEIFHSLVGFGVIVITCYSIHDIFFVDNLVFVLLDFVFVGVLTTGYFTSTKYNIYTKVILPIFITCLLLITVFYFLLGGFRGIVMFYYLILAFCSAVVLESRQRNIVYLSMMAIFLFVVPLQIYYPSIVTNVYKDTNDFNIFISFFISLGFIIYGSVTFRKYYDKANRIISDKNFELSKKSEEIAFVNDKLNQIVIERTNKIKIQNQKLIEYAFFNSHKVRGPLARVMGLVDLLRNSSSKEDVELYLSKLEESAKELDEVVGEINKILVEKVSKVTS